MLIRNRMARTISPAMTQISIAMPRYISPPEKSVLSSRFSVLSVRRRASPVSTALISSDALAACLTTGQNARHHIEVPDDPLRIAVPQKNLAVRSPDMHHLVAPDVSSRAPDAANAVAANKSPGLDRITHDRLLRNRAQTESKHPNLNPVPQETVPKPAPRHCARAKTYHACENRRPEDRRRPRQRYADHRPHHRQ